MKKFIWLIVGTLILFSCEREEFDAFDGGSKSGVQTRATSSIADFNPVAELDGILVNILNVGNTRNKYLSCVQNGTKVDLYNKDDGSGRQQWNIKYGKSIILPRGNNRVSSNVYVVAGADNWPIVGSDKVPDNIKLYFAARSNNLMDYHNMPGFGFQCWDNGNCTIGAAGGGFPLTFYYLKSESSISSTLKFKTDNSTALSQWQIVPIGEYEIVDLQYVRTSVDNITPKEVICARDEYQNSSSSTVTWDYTVTTKYSESSNFSKTEGVSATISAGLHVGLPNLLGKDGILDFNTSIQQQSNKSWNYGNSSTREVTETRTGHIPVPANTTMRLEATIVMYEGNVTYVATLRKIGDNKTFRVKGKWTGTSFSMFKAKTYNVSTNASLGVYSLE